MRTNYILSPRNAAGDVGQVSAPRELSGFEAANLTADRAELPWIPGDLAPQTTRLFVDYPRAEKTMALHLGRGQMPLRGSRWRVVRGDGLRPAYSSYVTVTPTLNATSTILRSAGPYDEFSGTPPYLGATAPGSDWSADVVFAAPETAWTAERDQILVVVASADGTEDAQLRVEMRNALGSFVELDTAGLAPPASGDRVRLGYRLVDADISTPPEIRLTGLSSGSSDAEVYHASIVNPVRLDGVLRGTGEVAASTGGVSVVDADLLGLHYRAFRVLDEGDGIVLTSSGTPEEMFLALTSYDRAITGGTLYLSIKQGAPGQSVTLDLFQGGTDPGDLVQGLGTATAVTAAAELFTFPVTSPATASELYLRVRHTVNNATASVGPLAVAVSYSDLAGREFDSGWRDVAPPTAAMAGSSPIDSVGPRGRGWVSITAAWSEVGGPKISEEIAASGTFVDLDVVADPDDPAADLSARERMDREIKFHELHEGPGLAGIKLSRSVSSAYEPLDVLFVSLGGFTEVTPRRGLRSVSLVLTALRQEVDLEEVDLFFRNAGGSVRALAAILPTEPGVARALSIYGHVTDRSNLSHIGATDFSVSFTMRGP